MQKQSKNWPGVQYPLKGGWSIVILWKMYKEFGGESEKMLEMFHFSLQACKINEVMNKETGHGIVREIKCKTYFSPQNLREENIAMHLHIAVFHLHTM